jgi:hypothetical protein
MSASLKKAIVRKLSRDWLAGYVTAEEFCREGVLELLDLAGKVTLLRQEELKWLCFVRDFNSGELANPERLLHKTFAGRPRTEGLFLRLRLSDGDLIEGIAANDRGLIAGSGLSLLPPDTRSNTQRLWIPPTAIAALEIVAVIGNAPRKKASAARPEPRGQEDQKELFP